MIHNYWIITLPWQFTVFSVTNPPNFNLKIVYLLFNYSPPTIRIIRIVFGFWKWTEYEYRIPLFGLNYSNSRIIRIIRDNTVSVHLQIRIASNLSGSQLDSFQNNFSHSTKRTEILECFVILCLLLYWNDEYVI